MRCRQRVDQQAAPLPSLIPTLSNPESCPFGDSRPIGPSRTGIFRRSRSTFEWRESHLVTQRSQRMGEFLQAKFQPCFYRSQRSMCRGGNFPVTESLEESELERLALKPRQHSHAPLEKMTQIIQHENIVCRARRVGHLLDHALLIPLAYARI